MDQQQNHIVSLVAVFLALGIGILVGASMGEKALVLHQIDFIAELKNEIACYKEEIDLQILSFMQLQDELLTWESLEEGYFNPLLLENKLTGINVQVIVLEDVGKGLGDFLQKSGCSFTTIFFGEESPGKEELFIPDGSGVVIAAGSPDALAGAFLTELQQEGNLVIQVTEQDNAAVVNVTDTNVTGAGLSFPVINNIEKFYNKVLLLELIQGYLQKPGIPAVTEGEPGITEVVEEKPGISAVAEGVK